LAPAGSAHHLADRRHRPAERNAIMRPKTARRLTLLAVVAIVGIGGGIGVVVVRKWRTEQRYDQYRADGLAAHERGDHADALEPLNRYIRGRDEHRDDA